LIEVGFAWLDRSEDEGCAELEKLVDEDRTESAPCAEIISLDKRSVSVDEALALHRTVERELHYRGRQAIEGSAGDADQPIIIECRHDERRGV
jgi:hypothetical protein